MPRFLKSGTTYRSLRAHWISRMIEEGVPDAKESFRHIFDKAVGGVYIPGRFPQLKNDTLKKINSYCQLRTQRVPLQEVIGEWDFRQLTLRMRSPVFVPRPETEGLVQLALDVIGNLTGQVRVLEVGCGTGAISLSLAKECAQVDCIAVDRSHDACTLARENVSICNLEERVRILKSFLNEKGFLEPPLQDLPFHLVVSNPPYVTTQEMKSLQPEILKYEDPLALCGGDDGLETVRSLLRMCNDSLLICGGRLLLEVGLKHPKIIRDLVGKISAKLSYVNAHPDFTGRDRFVEILKVKP